VLTKVWEYNIYELQNKVDTDKRSLVCHNNSKEDVVKANGHKVPPAGLLKKAATESDNTNLPKTDPTPVVTPSFNLFDSPNPNHSKRKKLDKEACHIKIERNRTKERLL
jgi:hypothetical protein